MTDTLAFALQYDYGAIMSIFDHISFITIRHTLFPSTPYTVHVKARFRSNVTGV